MGKSTTSLNPAFNGEITSLPGGEHLNSCFNCGACSGICPVSQAIPEFDPRKIIHMIRMGMKERLLTSDMMWYCSGCRSCVFVCPQDVSFADIMGATAKLALKEGYVTEETLAFFPKTLHRDDLPLSCATRQTHHGSTSAEDV